MAQAAPHRFPSRSVLSVQGVSGLLFLLLRGVHKLAAELLGSAQAFVGAEGAAELFKSVKDLCVEPLQIAEQGQESVAFNVFPGPHHLASLLNLVANDLAPSAIVNIKPPGDVDGTQWATVMRTIAKRRPYLWRNHRRAVDSGYLEVGQSAVVSFPTGAGKSTLAELKIATMLLLGKKVIFLAPTLALVDQTAKALRQTFLDRQFNESAATRLCLRTLLGIFRISR